MGIAYKGDWLGVVLLLNGNQLTRAMIQTQGSLELKTRKWGFGIFSIYLLQNRWAPPYNFDIGVFCIDCLKQCQYINYEIVAAVNVRNYLDWLRDFR